MITPRFQLSQTDNTISINIRAPYCSLRELEINVEESMFLFICKPYYLRLNLPKKITENDNFHSEFDSDSGEFTFTYDKETPGEDFPDLDFITKLLCPKVEVQEGNRKIEILTTDENSGSSEVVESDEKYGFALRGGYNFNYVSSEFSDIFKINPHKVNLKDRKILRLKDEKVDFNVDHYLADLFDGEEIQELIRLKSPREDLITSTIKFTNTELDFLKDLSNIEYNLNNKQINYCFNSLLEILFAYCYDQRTTIFETTCESGWTIAKLSASFNYFDAFETPRDAIICAFRRSLIYPLYRQFNLSCKVFDDLKIILKLGEKYIMKVLINIYNIFLNGNCRYILNNLFIKDYINYVMKWDKDLWNTVVDKVLNLKICEADLDLNLPIVDEDNVLLNGFVNMTIKENVSDSDDSDSIDTDSSSDDYHSCSSSSSETDSDDSD